MINHSKFIAITGGSGAGKTWLARRLQGIFGSRCARWSLDDFYRDLGHLPSRARAKINFDRPQAVDWPGFEKVLRDCQAGSVTRVPQYDFATHTRLSMAPDFTPTPLVIVEGLWLLWRPQISELFDLKIFLDCPPELRLERRLSRDVAGRGRTPASVREQFASTVAPMHEQFVAPQAKLADIVLKQPATATELRDLIETIELELTGPRFSELAKPMQEKCCLPSTSY